MKKLHHTLLCLLFNLGMWQFGSSHLLTCRKQKDAVEGAAMEVLCQSEVEIDSCAFDFPGFKKIKAYAGMPENQYYKFVGNYKTGECGIRFSVMKQELEGQVSVVVTFENEDAPAEATTNVIMLYPPKNCSVESNGNNFEFNEGDEMILTCSCNKSNPLPSDMSLRIIGDKSYIVNTQLSISASKTAEVSDFDQKEVCVVHQDLLEHGEYNSTPLTIFHKPRIVDSSKEQYVDDDGRKMSLYIKLTVSAFPKPHTINLTTAIKGIKSLLWNNFSVNPIEDSRYKWDVRANVSDITKEDFEHGLQLTIANSKGENTTEVIPGPPAEKVADDSNMPTIVIVTLIIAFIAVLAVVYWKWDKVRKATCICCVLDRFLSNPQGVPREHELEKV